MNFQRTVGFLQKLFGQNEENEIKELSLAIDSALRKNVNINEIRWYLVYNDNPEKKYYANPVL